MSQLDQIISSLEKAPNVKVLPVLIRALAYAVDMCERTHSRNLRKPLAFMKARLQGCVFSLENEEMTAQVAKDMSLQALKSIPQEETTQTTLPWGDEAWEQLHRAVRGDRFVTDKNGLLDFVNASLEKAVAVCRSFDSSKAILSSMTLPEENGFTFIRMPLFLYAPGLKRINLANAGIKKYHIILPRSKEANVNAGIILEDQLIAVAEGDKSKEFATRQRQMLLQLQKKTGRSYILPLEGGCFMSHSSTLSFIWILEKDIFLKLDRFRVGHISFPFDIGNTQASTQIQDLVEIRRKFERTVEIKGKTVIEKIKEFQFRLNEIKNEQKELRSQQQGHNTISVNVQLERDQIINQWQTELDAIVSGTKKILVKKEISSIQERLQDDSITTEKRKVLVDHLSILNTQLKSLLDGSKRREIEGMLQGQQKRHVPMNTKEQAVKSKLLLLLQERTELEKSIAKLTVILDGIKKEAASGC